MSLIQVVFLLAFYYAVGDGQATPCFFSSVDGTGAFQFLAGVCVDSGSCDSLSSPICQNNQVCCSSTSNDNSNFVTPATIALSPYQSNQQDQLTMLTYCSVPRNQSSTGSINGILGSGLDIISSRALSATPTLSGRVLSGINVVDMSRYCHIAAIHGANNQLLGAGSLINSQWIVTSVNVVQNYKNALNSLLIKLGQSNLNMASSSGSLQTFGVSRVVQYPGYLKRPQGYPVGDVMLLQLDRAVDFDQNPNLCAACLPTSAVGSSFSFVSSAIVSDGFTAVSSTSSGMGASYSALGERCSVAGYGVTVDNNFAVPDGQLREVMLPVIPRAVCDLVYRLALGPGYSTDLTSLCAGGEKSKDTCAKDGGVPLQCVSPLRKYPILAGISSWGLGCGRAGIPSVYTDLSNPNVIQFIKSIVGNLLPFPPAA